MIISAVPMYMTKKNRMPLNPAIESSQLLGTANANTATTKYGTTAAAKKSINPIAAAQPPSFN